MEKNWMDSKTKIAAALAVGGVVLNELSKVLLGMSSPDSLVNLWQAVVAAVGLIGVRGWFKE